MTAAVAGASTGAARRALDAAGRPGTDLVNRKILDTARSADRLRDVDVAGS